MAAAVSILSAGSGRAVPNGTCVFGEIGLTGEIRSVSRCAERLKEAEKLGFKNIILPAAAGVPGDVGSGMKIEAVKSLTDAVALLGMRH